MFYAFELDASGSIIGLHTYQEEPASYPTNEVPCTADQAANPQAWQVVKGAVVVASSAALLAQAKDDQKAIIADSYQAAANAPITDSKGIIWQGGKPSAQAIYLACQLGQQLGASSVTLYDSSNTGHSMTIADGLAVAALIGSAFQTAYQTNQARKNAIDAVKDTTAAGIAAVQAITW